MQFLLEKWRAYQSRLFFCLSEGLHTSRYSKKLRRKRYLAFIGSRQITYEVFPSRKVVNYNNLWAIKPPSPLQPSRRDLQRQEKPMSFRACCFTGPRKGNFPAVHHLLFYPNLLPNQCVIYTTHWERCVTHSPFEPPTFDKNMPSHRVWGFIRPRIHQGSSRLHQSLSI